MYVFFRIHSLVCVISLTLIVIAQALPSPHRRPLFIAALIHFYVLLAGVTGIIIELDISEWFLKNVVPILRYWFVRGFFYLLLGVFAAEESFFYQPPPLSDDSHKEGDESFWHSLGSHCSSLMLWFSAIGLFLTGALYIVMGAFFMQGLKKKSEEAYEKRMNDMLNMDEDDGNGEDD